MHYNSLKKKWLNVNCNRGPPEKVYKAIGILAVYQQRTVGAS